MLNGVTAKEMKEIERKAFERGMSYTQMMENAGAAAAEEIIKRFSPKDKLVAVAVGKGNNGGDGYVVARFLHDAGAKVKIIMAEGEPVTEDAKLNYERCQKLSIEIIEYTRGINMFADADLIIDGVYGAGFHGEFREKAAALAEEINSAVGKKIALDLPSGLCADDGALACGAVKADLTITFARLKCGQTIDKTRICGEIILKDIGI